MRGEASERELQIRRQAFELFGDADDLLARLELSRTESGNLLRSRGCLLGEAAHIRDRSVQTLLLDFELMYVVLDPIDRESERFGFSVNFNEDFVGRFHGLDLALQLRQSKLQRLDRLRDFILYRLRHPIDRFQRVMGLIG